MEREVFLPWEGKGDIEIGEKQEQGDEMGRSFSDAGFGGASGCKSKGVSAYQKRAALPVIREIKAKYLAGSHVSQPKSILMIKAVLNCKAVGEEREAWEKLPGLFELKASPICLTLLPKGRSLWGRFSGEH